MSFAWGQFSRKQLDVIAKADARLNILDGSVRSGKTISSLVAWIYFVKQAPPGELLMVGKTERTLKRNILDPLEQIVGTRNFKYNRGLGEVHLLGRRIYVAGANDERSEGKIRGMTLAGAYCDELSLYPESFFTMLLSRLSVGGARLLGTTNPDSPYHWLKAQYLDRAGELDLRHWHFTLDDNLNLDPAYVEALKKEYTGLWYKRFILGLWVLAEGAVYDMWDEDKYTRPAPEDLGRFIVAIDYGTSNPCTFGLYGWNNSLKPVVHLTREYWHDARVAGRQKTDAEYADDFKDWLGDVRPEAIYVDPSAASFIAELRKRGYRVRDADNEVIDGIRFVASMLTQERFFIDPSCKNTIKEFSAYVWDPKAQLKGEDKPLKQNDHAMDRNRYALYSHFQRMRTGPLPKPSGW
jgi:PBSX family phage terminase large subunit